MTEQELKEWKEEIKQERIEAQGEISQFVDGESLLFLIDKIFELRKEIKELKLELSVNKASLKESRYDLDKALKVIDKMAEELDVSGQYKEEIKDSFYKEIEE